VRFSPPDVDYTEGDFIGKANFRLKFGY